MKILSFKQRIHRSIVITLLVNCLFFGASILKGQEDEKSPKILKHTKQAMTLYKGDKVKLSVEAKGNSLNYRWVRKDKTICSAAECEMDTSTWGLGKHMVMLVVYNEHASQYLRFNVFILSSAPDFVPRSLVPEVVDASQNQNEVKEKDLLVQSLRAQGYSYTKEKIFVVGQVPRELTWEESLKTNSQSTLVIHQAQKEEHFVLPSSQVKLKKSELDRRILELDYGTVRSRVLDPKIPSWTILVGESIQVDGNEFADVVVRRYKKSDINIAEISVIRGEIRVLNASTESVEEEVNEDQAKENSKAEKTDASFSETIIRQGDSISIDESSGSISSLQWPDSKYMGRVMRLTSPHYLPKTSDTNPEAFSYGKYVIGSSRAESAKKSADKSRAKKWLAQKDYISVIEILSSHIGKAKQDYELAMMLADSYQAVLLYKEAFAVYKLAAITKPNAFDPLFAMGQMAIHSQYWALAEKWLDQASTKSIPNEYTQILNYYRGVAAFWQRKWYSARSHLKLSAWSQDKPEVSQSSETFLAKIDMQKSWYANVEISLGYDLNPLRISASIDAPEGYTKSASLFGLASVGGGWKFINKRSASLAVGGDLAYFQYADSQYKELGLLDEKLFLDFRYNFFTQDSNQFMQLGVKPYLKLLYIGSERSDDVFGLKVSASFTGVRFQPYASIDWSLHQDPLPARDDKLEPVTFEYIVPSERSQRIMDFEFGFIPYTHRLVDIISQVNYQSQAYRNQYVESESYSRIGLGVAAPWRLFSRAKVTPSLNYHTKNYADSFDSRKDSEILLKLDGRYFYSGVMSQNLVYELKQVSSSRSTNTYSRSLLMTGLKVEF